MINVEVTIFKNDGYSFLFQNDDISVPNEPSPTEDELIDDCLEKQQF